MNLFHPEDTLPAEDRAELEDYARSGFDRGHMTPSGDMPTPQAQEQSFSLANMVPQAPKLNRGIWERIEGAVRRLARREGRPGVRGRRPESPARARAGADQHLEGGL